MILPQKSTMNLIVIGSLGSGKTDLFKKLFCRRPASVSDILVGTLKYSDPENPHLQSVVYKALVLPANDSFKGTRARHYLRADAIAIVYNKAKYRTFEEIYKWIEEILSIRKKISLAIIEYTPVEKVISPYPTKIVTVLDAQELLQQIKKKYKLAVHFFRVNGLSEESINKFLEQITRFVIEAHTKRIPTELLAKEEAKREVIHL